VSLAFEVKARRGGFQLDVSFQSAARAIGVVGPSGHGKTTLLQGLAGLLPLQAGRLVLDGMTVMDLAEGQAPPAHLRGLGYVFQDGRLFPHLSVAGNVGFGQRYSRDPLSIEAALALVGLQGFEARWPASLSGGEARRVAIARALLTRPRLLLLDEPFTGLDAGRRAQLLPILLALRDNARTPMILVSHDLRDVEALCEDVLTLENGYRGV
jgi:molybdate transport system ATP-binding protein